MIRSSARRTYFVYWPRVNVFWCVEVEILSRLSPFAGFHVQRWPAETTMYERHFDWKFMENICVIRVCARVHTFTSETATK